MAIQYAILGLLSWRPHAGYDLKKIMASSMAFYWSGNNNQIYKTLVELHREGLVTQAVEQHEPYPPRKVYHITAAGRAELRAWVQTNPELPQFRNTFLVQLAWADQLTPAELDGVLARYEHEVEMRLRMLVEQERRGALNPARTPRESYLWRELSNYYLQAYTHELTWVRSVRQRLATGEI